MTIYINIELCQNLGASNRTPVRKTDTSRIHDRWWERKKEVCERQEKHASLVPRLISIGYYWL